MTESPTPANRPADPERGNSLRAWLVDALALGMGALAVFHYQPDGFAAGLIVLVGAYTLTHSLNGLNWVLLAGICEIILVWLAPAIHLGTLMMVPTGTSATGLVFTFLLPGIAQAYWFWELWPATGTVSHPLTVMCAAWLALLAIRILAQIIRVGWRAPHSLTPPRPDENTPKTEAALTSNADRCGQRPDHLHHRRGVAGSVEIDINDPQNEQSNKCGGNGFHKRLTIWVRQVFRAAITCVVPPGP